MSLTWTYTLESMADKNYKADTKMVLYPMAGVLKQFSIFVSVITSLANDRNNLWTIASECVGELSVLG